MARHQTRFNFAASHFRPGTQTAPVEAKLFGTDATGPAVDDAAARLGLFDGESTVVTPDGFLSLGNNGEIDFDLTSALSTAGSVCRVRLGLWPADTPSAA